MGNLCLFLFSSISPLSPFMPGNVEIPAKHIKYYNKAELNFR
jgi:hypothetical protein